MWTERALTRLREIHAYVAGRAPSRAAGVIVRLLDRADQLATAPGSGRRLTRLPNDEVREILERPYRIIYRVKSSRVEILTVKHYRQRLMEHPDEY